jgi:hypothetical protein
MTKKEYQKELERIAGIILTTVTATNTDVERVLDESVQAFSRFLKLDPKELKELVLDHLKTDDTERKVVRIEDCTPWANQAINRSGGKRLKAYKQSLYQQNKIDVAKRIEFDVKEILDGCGDPKQETPFLHKGLVVGKVQSGKTGNFSGVINAAYDVGYNTVIVLSGLTNKLREQTRDRLDNDVRELIEGESDIAMNDGDLSISTYREYLGYFASNKALLVIKKNVSVLNALLLLLNSEEYKSSYNSKRILIIDDECDNASISSFSRAEIEQYEIAAGIEAEGLEDEDNLKDRLYKAINLRIKGVLSSTKYCSYIGYTATPYNVVASAWDELDSRILIDDLLDLQVINSSLFPDHFIFRLEPGKKYLGIADYFSEDARYKEAVSQVLDFEDDYDLGEILSGLFNVEHHDLKSSFYDFVFALITRNHRGLIKHGSMMVHVDRRISRIDYLAHWFEELTEGLLKSLYDISKVDEVLNELNNKYQLWLKKSKSLTDDLNYPEIIEKKTLLLELDKLQVISLHSSNSERLKHQTHQLVYPKSVKEENRKNYVIVGGDMLSRGYTVEGLLVSYFVRLSTRADSLYQMARWCGYRIGEEDLVRIYTSPAVKAFTRGLIKMDSHLDKQFVDNLNAEDRISPRDWGLRLYSTKNDYTFKNKRLQVTDPNKLRFVSQRIVSGGGSYMLNKLREDYTGSKEDFGEILTELHALLSNNLFKKQESKFPTERPHLFRTKGKGAHLVLNYLSKYIKLEGGVSSEISISAILNAIGDGELDVLIVVLDKEVEGRTISQTLFPGDDQPHSLIERAYSRETFCTRLLDRDKERVAGLFNSQREIDEHRAKQANVRRKEERKARQELNRSLLAIYLAKNSSKEENKIENLILSYLILAGKSEFVYER